MYISRIAGGLFEHFQIESRILACIKDDFFPPDHQVNFVR